jgi:hypothetical protein
VLVAAAYYGREGVRAVPSCIAVPLHQRNTSATISRQRVTPRATLPTARLLRGLRSSRIGQWQLWTLPKASRHNPGAMGSVRRRVKPDRLGPWPNCCRRTQIRPGVPLAPGAASPRYSADLPTQAKVPCRDSLPCIALAARRISRFKVPNQGHPYRRNRCFPT